MTTTWEAKFEAIATDDAAKWEALEDADEIVGQNAQTEKYYEIAYRSYVALVG